MSARFLPSIASRSCRPYSVLAGLAEADKAIDCLRSSVTTNQVWVDQPETGTQLLEFTDKERTKAVAAVRTWNKGGSVLLEKTGGKWIAKGLFEVWTT